MDVELGDGLGLQVDDIVVKDPVIVLVETDGHALVRDAIHGRPVARIGAGIWSVKVGERVASILDLAQDGNALGRGLAVFALGFRLKDLGGYLDVVHVVGHGGVQELTPFERRQFWPNASISL